ncbi:MAG: hypothetical protein ACRDD1_20300, partial [Planctomycetia bacterium]
GSDALTGTAMDIRRVVEYIMSDRKGYWTKALSDRREELAVAKADLARRKMQGSPDRPVDLTEQKKNLDRAERRLEEAEEKLAAIKKWSRALVPAIEEYDGHARRLATLLEGRPPMAVLELDRCISAVEAYLALQVPMSRPADDLSASGATAGSATTSAAPTVAPAPAAEAPKTETPAAAPGAETTTGVAP